jgi:nitroreductase
MSKIASNDHPIHELIAKRWSPYAFQDKPVSQADLRSLFEALRWAPSSYNEQPWSYLIATKDDEKEFARLLSCLVEGNQAWAKNAPVLAISVVSENFKLNGQPNAAAEHDMGLAAGNLTFEAMARGLYVHQMIGILPDRVRELYQIPQGRRALTGLAIGYRAEPETLPEKLRERDAKPRDRKPLREIVFQGKWGETAKLVEK